MVTTTTYPSNVSQVDALWALYKSQTKKVREAFRMRIFTEEAHSKHEEELQVFAQQIPAQELQAAHALAETVKQGVADVRQAMANNTHVGRRAEDFLAELEQE